MSRVTSSTVGGGSTTYTYDGASNILGSTNGGTTTVYKQCGFYPNSLSGTVTQCSTDKDGNILSITGGWTYSYNYEDKMTTAKLNGATKQTDVYDGAGMRVEKTETDSTIFSYLGVNLMYEKDISTGTVADHIYGDGLQVAKVTGGVTYYYHEDQVGSNRLVTYVNAGTVTNKFSSDYQPFGTSYNNTGSEVMQYTDRMLDPSDNLYYFNARTYNSSIMRFMTKDPPAGAPCACSGNTKLYSYAASNPLRNVDPTGDYVMMYRDGGGGGGGGGITTSTSPSPPTDPTATCVQQCVARGTRPDICLAECQSGGGGSKPQCTIQCWFNDFASCQHGLSGLELACLGGCALGSVVCGPYYPVCFGACATEACLIVTSAILVACAVKALHDCGCV